MLRVMVAMCLAVGISIAAAPANAAGSSYTVKLDGAPPKGEPWAFLRFFPNTPLSVHQGDVVDFSWAGTDTPHTATLVPDANAESWRATNQGKGGIFESPIPDSQVGGDDGDLIENPTEVFPTDPTCGVVTTPCSFDGTGVVSSGLQFSNPSQEPSFFASIDAPVGTYSFLCLLHPGMEVQLKVVDAATSVPNPAAISAKAAKQLKRAIKVDGAAADAQAQTVGVATRGSGTTVFVNAGGFSNQVTANEYPDNPIKVHVGDKIKFAGTGEIHTATFPASAAKTTPFIFTECEQPGADAPATSPLDCSDPSKFEVVDNAKALSPTHKHSLTRPTPFENSGILVPPLTFTFVATTPGTYKFICLVHGPEMSGVIRVVA